MRCRACSGGILLAAELAAGVLPGVLPGSFAELSGGLPGVLAAKT